MAAGYTPPKASAYYRAANRRAMPRSSLANYQRAARMRTSQVARGNYNGPGSHAVSYGGNYRSNRVAYRQDSTGNVYKAANWRKAVPFNPYGNYFNDRLMQRLGGDEAARDAIAQRMEWTQAMQDEFLQRSQNVSNVCAQKFIRAQIMMNETDRLLNSWQDGSYNPSSPKGTPAQPPQHMYRPLSYAWAPQMPAPPPPLWPVPDAEPGIRGQEWGYW